MGSWNHTCVITKLPIQAGEEVVVFILKQNGHELTKCYSTSYYSPMLYHFYGEYDDYGGVKNCHGFGLLPAIEEVRNAMVEMPLGENKYHDHAVSKADFNITKFFELDHDHRLFTKNNHFKPDRISSHPLYLQITHIVIRKQVFESLLAGYIAYTSDTMNGYKAVKFTFQDCLTTVVEIMQVAKHQQLIKNSLYADYPPDLVMEMLIAPHISRYGFLYGIFKAQSYNILSNMADILKSDSTDQQISDFAYQITVRAWMHNIMEDGRQMWCPPSGAGSQNDFTNTQRLIARITIAEAKALKS